jgi:hypothetical protein
MRLRFALRAERQHKSQTIRKTETLKSNPKKLRTHTNLHPAKETKIKPDSYFLDKEQLLVKRIVQPQKLAKNKNLTA